MPLARGAVAVGADGLIIEVHPNPKEALSDGPQSLNPENLMILSKELKQTASISGRYFRDGN
jgi:3-deoxy-7-phosphoheptulonate synthase